MEQHLIDTWEEVMETPFVLWVSLFWKDYIKQLVDGVIYDLNVHCSTKTSEDLRIQFCLDDDHAQD